MPKGYWLANVDVHDAEAMKRYRAANGDVLKRYGANFLVVGGRQTIAEGERRSRQTVVEFPSYEAAMAAYQDPDYQAALTFRKAGADGELVIVEGFEPPPKA